MGRAGSGGVFWQLGCENDICSIAPPKELVVSAMIYRGFTAAATNMPPRRGLFCGGGFCAEFCCALKVWFVCSGCDFD